VFLLSHLVHSARSRNPTYAKPSTANGQASAVIIRDGIGFSTSRKRLNYTSKAPAGKEKFVIVVPKRPM
jgi:hypothetical protein